MEVEVKTVVSFGGELPERATALSAGVDLRAARDGLVRAGARELVPTALSMEIPAGVAGLVCSRSGLALRQGVIVLNAPGVVDADYRGQVGVILANLSGEDFAFRAGDRIAQLLLVPVFFAGFREVAELADTERGAGGFGSTGVAS